MLGRWRRRRCSPQPPREQLPRRQPVQARVPQPAPIRELGPPAPWRNCGGSALQSWLPRRWQTHPSRARGGAAGRQVRTFSGSGSPPALRGILLRLLTRVAPSSRGRIVWRAPKPTAARSPEPPAFSARPSDDEHISEVGFAGCSCPARACGRGAQASSGGSARAATSARRGRNAGPARLKPGPKPIGAYATARGRVMAAAARTLRMPACIAQPPPACDPAFCTGRIEEFVLSTPQKFPRRGEMAGRRDGDGLHRPSAAPAPPDEEHGQQRRAPTEHLAVRSTPM